ncbi:MAG TPA: tetratricopeptide repeat protein [Bryobacteraceae bacterium]|nr:tetratricopeptide repeat protein [Bryobacteraceae bacterium]
MERQKARVVMRLALVVLFAPGLGAQTVIPAVTWSHDIAPLVYAHCASCHRPGEAGPFPLLTYNQVKARARMLATVTQSRYMPPWLPQSGYGDFADANRLTDAEIKKFADWAAQGAPEGIAAQAPAAPQYTEGWQLGPPDLIVEADKAYALPASGAEVYWNFVMEPRPGSLGDKPRYVRAMEVRPGDKRIVHHAVAAIDRSHWGREQEPSPGEGFPGMELANRRSIFDPDDGHFLYWKPGGAPYVEPDGLAWRLDPGNAIVLNTHLRPSGKPEQIRPVIGLYFTDKPQTKSPMLVQLEHDGSLDIPAGARDFVDADDFKLPMDADVLAVYPHAHYLARLIEGYVTLPDGTRKWLIRIPEWDQSWQTVYRYREPVFLPKGAAISMRIHYDNSAANIRNPNQPPKRVQAGNHATDEMGHFWLQVLPRGGDRRLELNQALMQHRLEKYPNDFRAHMILGALYLARLNAGAAVPMAEAATRIEPKDADAHNLYGSALAAVGRVAESIEQYRSAVALRPDFVNARFNLANALARAGRSEEAITNYRQVLAAYPDDSLAKQRLSQALVQSGDALARAGKQAEADQQYDEAVTLDPTNRTAIQRRDTKRP